MFIAGIAGMTNVSRTCASGTGLPLGSISVDMNRVFLRPLRRIGIDAEGHLVGAARRISRGCRCPASVNDFEPPNIPVNATGQTRLGIHEKHAIGDDLVPGLQALSTG